MDKRDSKDEAVDALFDAREADAANQHAVRLTGAFGARKDGALPDFEKIRQSILKRHAAREADRRRFRRVWVPAAAAASVLMAAAAFLLIPKPPAPVTVAADAAVMTAEAQPLKIADSLTLQVRAATGMSRVQTGTAVTLKASTMAALFDFEPNERLKSVRIEVPRARFTVIGTRFIIDSEKEFCLLTVESGAVRVEADGRDFMVRGGEFWISRDAGIQSGKSGERGAKLFSDFTAGHDFTAMVSALTAKAETAVAPAKPAERRVAVTLKSGSVVTGVLISETPAAVEIRAAAAGNQVLRFGREEITVIQYLK